MSKIITTCMSLALMTGLYTLPLQANPSTENFKTIIPASLIVKAESNTFSGGTGTQEDPFQIASATDLMSLSQAVKSGNPYAGTYFKMMQDIDMASVEDMKPIGIAGSVFSGNFDGDNHTISNLTITCPKDMAVGLFGLIQNASIKNIIVDHSTITGNNGVGAIVGITVGSSIENCHTGADTKVITNQMYGGGIAGGSLLAENATISNCTNKAEVEVTMTSAGGILGVCENPTTITNCLNYGIIKAGVEYAGGIVGYISASITINDCGNVGVIESYGKMSGGISSIPNDQHGDIIIQINDCYNSGEIKGNNPPIIIPSPIGQQMEITNCYYNKDLFTESATYGTGMSAEDMKNGALLQALNHNRQPAVWYAAENVNGGMPVPFEITSSSIDNSVMNEQPEITVENGRIIVPEGYTLTNVYDMQGKAVENEALQEGIYVIIYHADNNRSKSYSAKIAVRKAL